MIGSDSQSYVICLGLIEIEISSQVPTLTASKKSEECNFLGIAVFSGQYEWASWLNWTLRNTGGIPVTAERQRDRDLQLRSERVNRQF